MLGLEWTPGGEHRGAELTMCFSEDIIDTDATPILFTFAALFVWNNCGLSTGLCKERQATDGWTSPGDPK